MKSVLEVPVSCFQRINIPTDPRPVIMLDWVRSGQHRALAEEIWATGSKEDRDSLMETHLPVITPAGTFASREAASLISPSGLMAFELDEEKNPKVGDWLTVKEYLSKLEFIAFCGLSTSGRGLWGLVPISDPLEFKRHHKALEEDFQAEGLVLDPAPPDIASARFYSLDLDPVLNHEARTYTRSSSFWSPLPTPGREKDLSPTERAAWTLKRVCDSFTKSSHKDRHWERENAALVAGGLVGANLVSEYEARTRVFKAANDNPKDPSRDVEVIEWGLIEGKKNPLWDGLPLKR